MISKPKVLVITILALLILSISVAYVAAQSPYTTEKTTNVTIGSNGTFTATEPSVDVSYQITGVPGTTGTVTAGAYSGNPQSTATVTSGISLTYFIAIAFNIPASDFTEAIVTINYTASEVQNIQSPYAIYKYISSSNSYVELPSTVDTTAKTITVTLNSPTEPLLAIGGITKTTTTSAIPTSTWIIIVVSAIIIIVLAVFVVRRLRPKEEGVIVVKPSGEVKPRPQAPTNLENKQQTATPSNQESYNPYSLISRTTNAPPKPEKPKINAAEKPQPPVSKTPENKTAKQPKKEKNKKQQNET